MHQIIVGDCSVTDDGYSDHRFEDAIISMNGHVPVRGQDKAIDAHMPDPIEGSKADLLERHPLAVPREPHIYDRPYRVLLPGGLESILIAGRTIAVSHMIDGSTWKVLVVMRMGQVVGTATALAAKAGLSPRTISFSQLKEALVAPGMEFGPDPSDVRQDPTLYPRRS